MVVLWVEGSCYNMKRGVKAVSYTFPLLFTRDAEEVIYASPATSSTPLKIGNSLHTYTVSACKRQLLTCIYTALTGKLP